MKRRVLGLLGSAIWLLSISGPACKKETAIKLATTTSTDNSGLLEVLLPAFTKESGIQVHVIAVGTGRALKHGENGDVDVVLVHARAAEDRFVQDGFGVNRRDVMYNDFVILGPRDDPAGVGGMKEARKAMAKIAESTAYFVSRGDDSGTHEKEKELWKAAKVKPSGKWHLSVGQGMGVCLTVADEKQGYVLADRGTYLAYREAIDLSILVEGDPALFNPYGVIAVNPAKHPHVKHAEAMKLIEWLCSPAGQEIIAGFEKNGGKLFHPAAGR